MHETEWPAVLSHCDGARLVHQHWCHDSCVTHVGCLLGDLQAVHVQRPWLIQPLLVLSHHFGAKMPGVVTNGAHGLRGV